MGKGLLLLAAPLWVALVLNLLGQLLARYALTRSTGLGMQWMSALAWLVGVGLACLVVYEYIDRQDFAKDWGVIAFLVFVDAVPVYVLSRRFIEVTRRWIRSRKAPG